MVSEFLIGIALTVGGIIVTVVAGILGWVVKKIWELKEDLDTITQSYGGSEYSQGHLQETRKEFERINSNLDDLQDLVCSIERRRKEEHEEVKEILSDVIEALHDEGINGDIVEPSDD